jgi:ElaB/YqjD/DUF883 family membrane-anchored ribosome-binding protein
MSHTKDDLRRTIGEGAARARGSAERAGEQAGEMMGDVRDYAEHLLDQSRDAYRQAAACAEEGIRHAGKVMRQNPGLTLSAAIGLGVMIGVVVGMNLGSDRGWR